MIYLEIHPRSPTVSFHLSYKQIRVALILIPRLEA